MATAPLIDSHCHLDLLAETLPLEQVIAESKSEQIDTIVVPAVSRSRWPLLDKYKDSAGIALAFGLHPCFAHQPEDIEALAAKLSDYPCSTAAPLVAVGECGLDSVAGKAGIEAQSQLLMAQLELAQQHELPVILHVRQAHNELLTILKNVALPAGGVVHGFSGSPELAMQYVRHGFYLGVGGVITYPRAAKTRRAIAQAPVDRLLLETDSPDMPLNGFQGQPNSPAQLPKVLNTLSELRGDSEAQLTQQLLENTHRCFPNLAQAARL